MRSSLSQAREDVQQLGVVGDQRAGPVGEGGGRDDYHGHPHSLLVVAHLTPLPMLAQGPTVVRHQHGDGVVSRLVHQSAHQAVHV